MSSISKLWKRQAVEFDGIYSGFLLNERQADQILEFIRDFSGRETLVVVDPVLGDNGKRYDILTVRWNWRPDAWQNRLT